MFFLYVTKIDLFSLTIFILIVLFCIPGTCVFYNRWKKIIFSIRDQIINFHTMWVSDYEQIINYDWPYHSFIGVQKEKTVH